MEDDSNLLQVFLFSVSNDMMKIIIVTEVLLVGCQGGSSSIDQWKVLKM